MRTTLVLLLALAAATVQGQITITNPPASVTLAWDASTDPAVTAYRVYWGVATRFYTNVVQVSGTTATVPNLVRGVKYYFAATCVATNGLESDFSNEINYTTLRLPVPPILRLSINNEKQLSGSGEPYAVYEIERSAELSAWEALGEVRANGQGDFSFNDLSALPQAFYRVKGVSSDG